MLLVALPLVPATPLTSPTVAVSTTLPVAEPDGVYVPLTPNASD